MPSQDMPKWSKNTINWQYLLHKLSNAIQK